MFTNSYRPVQNMVLNMYLPVYLLECSLPEYLSWNNSGKLVPTEKDFAAKDVLSRNTPILRMFVGKSFREYSCPNSFWNRNILMEEYLCLEIIPVKINVALKILSRIILPRLLQENLGV